MSAVEVFLVRAGLLPTWQFLTRASRSFVAWSVKDHSTLRQILIDMREWFIRKFVDSFAILVEEASMLNVTVVDTKRNAKIYSEDRTP
mmetsp:Transcript_10307/g.20775  ORF Transcript_10307/g.20775 Transcript_10307/m.20775 type:complete len:88 (+) Transcript_10307:1102-1365(+)